MSRSGAVPYSILQSTLPRPYARGMRRFRKESRSGGSDLDTLRGDPKCRELNLIPRCYLLDAVYGVSEPSRHRNETDKKNNLSTYSPWEPPQATSLTLPLTGPAYSAIPLICGGGSPTCCSTAVYSMTYIRCTDSRMCVRSSPWHVGDSRMLAEHQRSFRFLSCNSH